MSVVLLLNISWQPISVISWQHAITLLVLNKIQVIEEYNKELRSSSWTIKMPAVVRLVKTFKSPKKEIRLSKQNILARDKWTCQYCYMPLNVKSVTYDHVIPRSQGGMTCWENIVSSCADCNSRKGNLSLKETDMKLKKQPKKPKWIPFYTTRGTVPKQWKNYIN